MLFKDKDVICCLGDSITALGYWMAEAYQEIKKTTDVKFYNCGVAGSTAYKAEGYLYSNCLIHNPDWVVLMFGVNDIDRFAYAPEYNLPDKEKRINEAMARFKAAYESIIKKCQAFGSKVIVGIPVPYDEVSDNETENIKCQWGLDNANAFARELAEKYGCPVVDFGAEFGRRLPDSTIMRADRVHPTNRGMHIMAQTFLKETGVIDECDFDSEFVFEDWNKKRFDAEMELHYLNFTQLCAFFDPANPFADKNEIMEKVKTRLAESTDPDDYGTRCYREYIEKYPHRDVYEGELIKLTI